MLTLEDFLDSPLTAAGGHSSRLYIAENIWTIQENIRTNQKGVAGNHFPRTSNTVPAVDIII